MQVHAYYKVETVLQHTTRSGMEWNRYEALIFRTFRNGPSSPYVPPGSWQENPDGKTKITKDGKGWQRNKKDLIESHNHRKSNKTVAKLLPLSAPSSALLSSHQFSSVLIGSHDSRTFQVGKAAAQPIRTAGKISRGLHLHLRKLTCKECFKGVPHMGRIRKALENAHQSKQGFYMILAPHPTVAVLAPHPSMLVHCRTSK